jgi:hypothetical protein
MTRKALVAVRCPQHGATMERRPAHTAEQAWCGAWWVCTHNCRYSVLFESPALRQQWREQLGRTAYRSDLGRATEAYLAAWDAAHQHEAPADAR